MEKLEDPILPVTEIVAKCPAEQLMALYKVPPPTPHAPPHPTPPHLPTWQPTVLS